MVRRVSFSQQVRKTGNERWYCGVVNVKIQGNSNQTKLIKWKMIMTMESKKGHYIKLSALMKFDESGKLKKWVLQHQLMVIKYSKQYFLEILQLVHELINLLLWVEERPNMMDYWWKYREKCFICVKEKRANMKTIKSVCGDLWMRKKT